MKTTIIALIILATGNFIKAQNFLPEIIKSLIPYEYKIASSLFAMDDTTAEGLLVLSIPQNNNCFGADTAYITISYKYFDKGHFPNAALITQNKASFDKGTISNHKLTVESISKGLLNTHDKEYLSCTELFNGADSKSYYYYYFLKYKCKGFAKDVDAELIQQPDEYHYTDIYLTARADEAVLKKDLTVIFHGTFIFDEAHYHTRQLLDLFLGIDFDSF